MNDESPIEFSATVAVERREAVEALFFFNPLQPVWFDGIRTTVELTGAPRMIERDDHIFIELAKTATQCLFACDDSAPPAPIGVVLYSRPDAETLWISHLAIDPGYARGGQHGNRGLAGLLVGKVAEIARQIRGVRRLQLPYGRSSYLRVRSA